MPLHLNPWKIGAHGSETNVGQPWSSDPVQTGMIIPVFNMGWNFFAGGGGVGGIFIDVTRTGVTAGVAFNPMDMMGF